MSAATRQEHDALGTRSIPADVLWGIHTARALENFPTTGRTVPRVLIAAYGHVKAACLQTLRDLGHGSEDPAKADALRQACDDLVDGRLDEWIVVDLMQGGAGTSLNMNVNEVLANRALQCLGEPLGRYDRVHPLDDVNRYQSTNDTFPTALKVALLMQLGPLEEAVVHLQESLQAKEKQFADIVKVGRTQMQDAVLTTVGREFGAWAECISRDRWRLYKCRERLRVINLGGTAIGTGAGAEQSYIFRVTETLRNRCGLGLARAENLADATAHADVFAEVSGLLKTHAVSLIKICQDLRWLSSGPQAGIGELKLPARQAGSSLMPGKVNPVICEYVLQAAWKVCGLDVTVTQAAAAGSLELNPFLPLVAACLLEAQERLTWACRSLADHCITGIEVDREVCRRHVESSTAWATLLVPVLGYDAAGRVAREAAESGRSVRSLCLERGLLAEAQFEALLAPDAVGRLGFRRPLS